jgi:hypothetical protein
MDQLTNGATMNTRPATPPKATSVIGDKEWNRRANSYPRLVEAMKQVRSAAISLYLRGAEIEHLHGAHSKNIGKEIKQYAQAIQNDVEPILRELGEIE